MHSCKQSNPNIHALLEEYNTSIYAQCATHGAAPGPLYQQDHSISIHEKSGLSSCSQPNLAALSPSALPSAGLSAACLEVNSFMIPLSVQPVFKWLILPLWQRLARPVAPPPPSLCGIDQPINKTTIPGCYRTCDISVVYIFTKCAGTTKWHIWSCWRFTDTPFSEGLGFVTGWFFIAANTSHVDSC